MKQVKVFKLLCALITADQRCIKEVKSKIVKARAASYRIFYEREKEFLGVILNQSCVRK